MRKAKISLSVAAVGALVATGVVAAPSANAAPHRRTVARSAPTWVSHAHSVGDVKSSALSKFKVYLAPNGGIDALKADVARISDPSSSSYRHFLTEKQFHAKYDARSATVRQVTSWLKSEHLKVTGVEAHHRYLSVQGSNAAVQKAFAVTLKRFKHDGRTVQANTKAVTVPSSVAAAVLSVAGLDTTPQKVTHQVAPPPAGFRNARPCSRYYGQLAAKYQADYKTPLPKFQGKTLPYAVCGYTGPQYRAAYQGANPSGLDGTGATVAITDAYAAPTIASDANKYGSEHGDGSYTAGQFTQNLPSSYNSSDVCGENGWYGEETLDVEAVHAMAPGAKIRYYGSSSCYDDDFLATLGRVVDENKASIVTNSWSDVEEAESPDLVAGYEQVFMQGAMQGITFMFSSGDNGDELASTGIKQTDYPSSDPYVTSVGGTADAIGSDGSFLFQTGWGTQSYSLSSDGKSWTSGGYLYGAGGGVSSLFDQPSWQKGVVPSQFSAGRATPDLALDADPQTGMLIGETQTFPDGAYYDEYRIGGTSLASPLFAGQLALISQHAKSRVGFIDPSIYKLSKSGAFTDIKGAPADAGQVRVNFNNSVDNSDGLSYIVRTFNQDSSLQTAPGWDEVTGVGSPNPSSLTATDKLK